MTTQPRLFWVVLQRFDLKPDKSTWLEMSRGLARLGWRVQILTSYGLNHYDAGTEIDLRCLPRINRAGLFRVTALANIGKWLWKHAEPEDVVILSPGELWLLPFLRLGGLLNIHLDVRTIPVEISGLKRRTDWFVWWRIPMSLFANHVESQSFITARLSEAVTREFRLRPARSVIWESGVNVERFSNAAQRTGTGGSPIFFYHGTLSPNRGLDQIIEALTLLHPEERNALQLVIVGDGPDAARLKRIVQKNDLQDTVEFRGLIPYEHVPTHLAEANCCICPLPSRPEWDVSSPLKVFEYMAAGKPMILTPIPAHVDVLNETSFVVWSRGFKAPDFAAAIKEFLDRRGSLERAAAQQGPSAARPHDWQQLAIRLSRHLETTFRQAI